MNSIKTNKPISFPDIESKSNVLATLILQVTSVVTVLVFFCLFVLGPVYGIYKRGFSSMLPVALVGWGISLLILIPVIRSYIIKRKNLSRKIVVNPTGLIFYNSKNEVVEQLLYTELHPSKQHFDVYIVHPAGGSLIPLLEVTVHPEKKEKVQRRIDMNLPFRVLKNKVSLYAHFMHGISVFRPDLTIDPLALKSFSIDPEIWEIKKMKRISWGGWLLILAVMVVTCICIGIAFVLSLIKK
ncbi:hypothetical protein ABXT08_14435 [Chryseobacterium sp. NRRL B-14859]|uniref:hypothetical protein n=1 Tax=Chryseobacterium sp. NRRL B-14859 TaxID=1562763 RepID=UPI00339201B9